MSVTSGDVSLNMTIEDGETLIQVSGTRDAALIVYSESGEEVYLPPEEFEDEPKRDDLPHATHYEGRPPEQNPYEGVAPADSPYDSADGTDRSRGGDAQGLEPETMSVGVETTASGFRVFHPEPVTDLRFVKG